MKNWLILHNLQALEDHPDYIGRWGKKKPAKFKDIKKSDNVIYYCTGDMVIVGIYKVVSNIKFWPDDKYWKGPHWVYKIKAILRAPSPRYININEMLKEIIPPLKFFPKGKVEGIKLKGQTALSISKADFVRIKDYVKNYKAKVGQDFRGVSNDEGLGEPLDLEVMNYAPTSEAGVVVLFSHFLRKLGFEKIEFVRSGFPDACVLQRVGKSFHRKFIEFEFLASKFKEHVKNPKHRQIKCDYVVCWENDYKTCPVQVIELKSELKKIAK